MDQTGPYEKVYETKVDEFRTHFDTGAQRSGKAGKGRYDLMPTEAKRRKAIKYQQGAEAYGERNWEKGMPFSSLIDSAMRHLDQYTDGDISEDHLAAAAWNIDALMHFEKYRPDLDDRPKYVRVEVEPKSILPQFVGQNSTIPCQGNSLTNT